MVRISLPNTKSAAELDLDVQATYLRLTSIDYRLAIYLPHKVDHEKGSAKWDSKTEALSISLPILREDLLDRVAPLD